MTSVAAFAGMRLENQVIAHPDRIETVSLRAARAFAAVVHRHMRAEMRQQETEFEFCVMMSCCR